MIKRIYPWLLTLLALPAFGASVPISALPSSATITGDDLLEITDDPSGAKVSKSITAAKIFAGALASDSEISCIAALSSAANKFIYFTGSGTCALADVTSFVRTLLGSADATAAQTTLGLLIGTDVEAWDTDLDDWAGKTAPSGTAVGTSDTQTLTNKSISGSQITSAVATATAFAANGTNCSAGNYPLGVDASGNAEGCTAAAAGSGDASTNTSSSVDSEVTLFSGTGGKTLKRATGSGLAKLTSGVLSTATSGTDYVVPAGNVATATALAANGSNCSAGNYPLGVDASGAVESCTAATTGADPSASIGLSAVNGAATTYMRSDAAPALDVSIAPTWTGIHSWSLAEPRWKLRESDQGSDLTLWDFDLNNGVLTGRTRTDADGAGSNWLSVARGATTAISSISFGNATDNPTYAFLGSGALTFNGSMTSMSSFNINSSNPQLRWRESDQSTDLKYWLADVDAGIWTLRTATDALGAGVNAIAVTRGTTTAISSISFGNATNNPNYNFLGTGNAIFSGNITYGSATQSSTSPGLKWVESDQSTDLKRWFADVNGAVWKLRTLTDADATGKDAISIVRGTTTAVASLTFGNSTDNPSYTFSGNGATTYSGQVSAPRFNVNATAAAPTTGIGASAGNNVNFYTQSTSRGGFDGSGNFYFKQAEADQSYSIQTPTTGFSITVADNTSTLSLIPAGSLAAGTITMPANPIDGQRVYVSSSQAIATLTVSANTGQTILNAPTTLNAGAGFGYFYNLSSTRWVKLY